MATALPKQSGSASIDLFEGLQTVSLNLPAAPSHPIILTTSSVDSITDATSNLLQQNEVKAPTANETTTDNVSSSTKLSKLYTSEVFTNNIYIYLLTYLLTY
jgi:hypothetical protein